MEYKSINCIEKEFHLPIVVINFKILLNWCHQHNDTEMEFQQTMLLSGYQRILALNTPQWHWQWISKINDIVCFPKNNCIELNLLTLERNSIHWFWLVSKEILNCIPLNDIEKDFHQIMVLTASGGNTYWILKKYRLALNSMQLVRNFT